MIVEKGLSDKIARSKRDLASIMIRIKCFDAELEHLLKELETNPEEVIAFASNADNFSPSVWEQLQKEKKQRDEQLDLLLENVYDPSKAKKASEERAQVQRHWFFVR